MKRALLAALAVLALAPTLARADSPRWGSFEFGMGPYRPDLDAALAPSSNDPAYQLVFGSTRRYAFRTGVSYALLQRAGTLEVGLRSGWFRASAKGIVATTGARSGDPTTFNVVPTSLTLTWRADFIPEHLPIPLAPYVRVAAERYNWWITNGAGNMAKKGATNGWSATAGLAFSLNVIDPTLAREMDTDSGVNTTYLYFDVTKAKIDDLGSKTSWDLSPASLMWSAGVLLSF
ncbi:MAG: MXAN_2562 family outer membrane beta-barrel protein [Anaeromyxobacteraceae bacterium]